MSKKVVAVLFGGQSSEHDISKVSAATVMSNINQDKYYILPIYITKEGHWLLYDGPIDKISSGNWEKYATSAVISPDVTHKGILRIVGDKVKIIPIDVVFPVLHGAYGEDGTVQGLFELAKIPYCGCGVLSSSVSMNKAYTKIIAATTGVEQAKYVVLKDRELEDDANACADKVEAECGYPCFVKPACAGSSVGISKAHNRDELIEGLWTAAKEDKTIVVEENIEGLELECAVLGNDTVAASAVGQIIPAAEFYDFDAKYNNSDSRTIVPADIDSDTAKKIQSYAIKIFKALDGKGLSRVDFFLKKDGTVVFNEINTMPGFTSISMYPMLFKAAGIETEDLVEKIISLALTRYE
ncbi:MAG: D-alanine--D-alanine ligase [Firmicutes bacterium]|nr:D-alanine--D-alanine ligase [Bacillota bacterium]